MGKLTVDDTSSSATREMEMSNRDGSESSPLYHKKPLAFIRNMLINLTSMSPAVSSEERIFDSLLSAGSLRGHNLYRAVHFEVQRLKTYHISVVQKWHNFFGGGNKHMRAILPLFLHNFYQLEL